MTISIEKIHNLYVSLAFDYIELVFKLEVDWSVFLTKSYRLKPNCSQEFTYLDGSILFRKAKNTSDLSLLIPGQEGPLQTLIPSFIKNIEIAESVNIEQYVQKGELSKSLTAYYDIYQEKEIEIFSEEIKRQLTNCVVEESYRGRICFYKYNGEYILEIEDILNSKTYTELVELRELIKSLFEIEKAFCNYVNAYIKTNLTYFTDIDV